MEWIVFKVALIFVLVSMTLLALVIVGITLVVMGVSWAYRRFVRRKSKGNYHAFPRR